MPSYNEVIQKSNDNLPDDADPKIRSAKHREVVKYIAQYATNIIKMLSIAGTSITNDAMKNREVGAVMIDDITKNTGFTKTLSSNILTFTDGTEFITGQQITIFLA